MNPIASLLEDDHASLGTLLHDLDVALSKHDAVRAFALLDFLWARLAVHIRAENLQLFPKLKNVPPSSFDGRGGRPSIAEAQDLFRTLRTDHDFFMKEFARAIEKMRALQGAEPSFEEFESLRHRLSVIKARLENHNRLEEKHIYVWPSLLFDELTINELCEGVRRELENLPPRFKQS